MRRATEPTRIRRTRRSLVIPILLTLLFTLLFPYGAVAVNSTGAFELDGNAVTDNTTAGPPDDWDRVCQQVNNINTVPPTGLNCSTTNGTNGTTAVEWAAQTASGGTTFTGGGSKDPIDISSWAWNQASGGLPGKDVLLNGFAARYTLPANSTTCPSSTSTCSVIFFGMDRFDNAGDAQNGFWFFQNKVTLGTAKSGGGQTFNGVHKNGDVLVVSDFSIGGTTSTITVYVWNSACTGAGKPLAACADSNLQTLQTSTAANCATSAANAPFCGIVNPNDGTASPWPFTDKKGNSTFANGEFYEGGINLSAFPGLAGECFASTLAESRSSTSTSAVLKSFVLGNFGSCTSGIKTTPQPNGSVSIGTGSVQVQDQAVVTVGGASSFDGSVTFHLCGPADLVSQTTCATGGTLIGSAKTIGPPSPATVTSDLATITSAGNYCWRGDYSGDTANGVPASSDSSTTECFTVTPVTPTLATTAGPGPVLLGQPVTDTATLSGTANQPGSPIINGPLGAAAGGTITFTLFGPNNCTTTATGTGTNPQTVSVSGDATYGPVSFTPNAVGTYHWVASYSGNSPNTNATSHNTACNDAAEDVVVRQLPTTTVTTPVDGSGTTVTSVSFNSSVFDHAVVTGSAAGGTPTGTVSFFICDPSQVTGSAGSEVCATGNGTALAGNPVTATAIPSSNPPQSEATSSPAVVANKTGVWCFRASYTPNTSGYLGSSDATHDECFTATDTTSTTTAQDWLPNDSATITSGGSPLDGNVTFTLYSGAGCTGSVLYSEGPITVISSTNMPVITHNTLVKVTASTSVSWKVVYASNNPNVSGSSTCENTTLTITN